MTEFRLTPITLARIKDLARAGRDEAAIARRFGCTVQKLRDIARDHGIDLRPEPIPAVISPSVVPRTAVDRRLDPTRRGTRNDLVVLPVHLAASARTAFDREAARRGTTVDVLAAVCLELIAGDALFAAVLDN